jgi:hypothetical protein
MAYTRTVNKVECLDPVSVGDSLCDSSGEPIINKAFQTLNGLQNIGYLAASVNGILNGFQVEPFNGNYGSVIREVASYDKTTTLSYFPGYTHYELTYTAKLAERTSTSTEQTIRFELDINGIVVILDEVSPSGSGTSRAIGTSEQRQYITLALPVTIPIIPLATIGAFRVVSLKSNPQNPYVTGGSNYWDGIFEAQLRLYKNC